jgi:hypothetical protein
VFSGQHEAGSPYFGEILAKFACRLSLSGCQDKFSEPCGGTGTPNSDAARFAPRQPTAPMVGSAFLSECMFWQSIQ